MANMYGKQVSDARDAFGAIASCGVAVRVTRETHLPIEVMRRAAADASLATAMFRWTLTHCLRALRAAARRDMRAASFLSRDAHDVSINRARRASRVLRWLAHSRNGLRNRKRVAYNHRVNDFYAMYRAIHQD